MAEIKQRVSGYDEHGKRRSKTFPDTTDGKVRAKAFRCTLTDTKVMWDVRTRINGRAVMKSHARRKDADAYAAIIEADKLRGVAVDPRRARVSVKEYADRWLAGRHDLAERTTELYSDVLDRHIFPTFGERSVGSLTPSAVRTWFGELASAHPATASKAYRLLSTIMRAAMSDELITRNPCQVKGASKDTAKERPVASVDQVAALAAAMPPHLRMAVLLAAWCQLRRGEVLGLRRMDIDLQQQTVTVAVTRGPGTQGRDIVKPPKTAAGHRMVAIPVSVLGDFKLHLDTYVSVEPDAPVLVGEKGAPLRAHVLGLEWRRARSERHMEGFRFHDLRHSGLTWAASTGATVAELMHRAGHASPVAALRYQHATVERDRRLAAALAEMAPMGTITPIRPRDDRAMETATPVEHMDAPPLLNRHFEWQPQRGSNPCLHLERVVS